MNKVEGVLMHLELLENASSKLQEAEDLLKYTCNSNDRRVLAKLRDLDVRLWNYTDLFKFNVTGA